MTKELLGNLTVDGMTSNVTITVRGQSLIPKEKQLVGKFYNTG